MKKITVTILSFLIFCSCESNSEKIVRKVSQKHDPAKLKLEKAYNKYAKRTYLPSGIALGIINFQNGDFAKYWFMSHHSSNDMGCTLFELSNGEKITLDGWFCCGVDLPEKQLKSKNELQSFIKKHDGIRP